MTLLDVSQIFDDPMHVPACPECEGPIDLQPQICIAHGQFVLICGHCVLSLQDEGKATESRESLEVSDG